MGTSTWATHLNATVNKTLRAITCDCGVLYGLDQDFIDARRRDGKTFYCPNGCDRVFRETEEQRLKQEVTRLKAQVDGAKATANLERRWRQEAEEQAAAERRSAAAIKGHLTRMRRRVANGVCPVPGCKRSGFSDVMRHLSSKHADWLHEHPEVADA